MPDASLSFRRRAWIRSASVAVVLAAWGRAACATAALAPPTGPVVLTVSGPRVTRTAPGPARFDLAALGALPQRVINTRTPWYPGARRFTGPLLRDVLAAAGVDPAAGGQLQAIALNDYRVDIPMEDTVRYDVIVATRLDDKPLAVRDKGPLFVMYPFDERPEIASPAFFSRCIWQRAIEVR